MEGIGSCLVARIWEVAVDMPIYGKGSSTICKMSFTFVDAEVKSAACQQRLRSPRLGRLSHFGHVKAR